MNDTKKEITHRPGCAKDAFRQIMLILLLAAPCILGAPFFGASVIYIIAGGEEYDALNLILSAVIVVVYPILVGALAWCWAVVSERNAKECDFDCVNKPLPRIPFGGG